MAYHCEWVIDWAGRPVSLLYLKAKQKLGQCGVSQTVLILMLPHQVARKLVIIESDLERTEERAELSESYVYRLLLCNVSGRHSLNPAWTQSAKTSWKIKSLSTMSGNCSLPFVSDDG